MSKEEKNDLFYVCSLLEYIARITKNERADIVKLLGKQELERQLELAEVNHCLTFEQVADELIEDYRIPEGKYDSVGECLYEVPSFLAIGKDYQRLVEDVQQDKGLVETLYGVMTSFIVKEISNFNSSVYYSSREYLKACYEAGMLLE